MSHRSTLGIAAAIALALASCAAAPQSAPTSAPTKAPLNASANAPTSTPVTSSAQQEMPTELLLSGGGKKAVVHSGLSAAPKQEAQLSGSLVLDGAGCVTVLANDGETTTLVFPDGTRFEGESLLLPDGSSLSAGISVALKGARVPANESLSMCLNYARLLSVEKASVGP